MSLGRQEKPKYKPPTISASDKDSDVGNWATVTSGGTWFIAPSTHDLESIIRHQRAEELYLASDIIDATVGKGACPESRYALAIKYNVEQLTKLLDFIKQL